MRRPMRSASRSSFSTRAGRSTRSSRWPTSKAFSIRSRDRYSEATARSASALTTSRSPSRRRRSRSTASPAKAAIPSATYAVATAGSRLRVVEWCIRTSCAASVTTPRATKALRSAVASSASACSGRGRRTSVSSTRTTSVIWSSSDASFGAGVTSPRGKSMLIKVPISWLREYVDITVPIDELALKVHMSSTEVKGVERPWWGDKVRTARVEKLAKHPNADKLQLATVDYGAGSPKTVVTGATNLKEGAIVPYADEGAEIIDGHTGERATLRGKPMRGIQSEGMVLSEKELGLSDEHEGILLLDPKLPVGALLREVLGETVLALDLQPNRPDCFGIVGIAREVAALLGTSLREPPLERLGTRAPNGLDVRIEDDHACPRFAAALLTGVRIGPSPEWMQPRVVAAGMRTIDNVVDITNYVMLELGQPLHAYDQRKLRA